MTSNISNGKSDGVLCTFLISYLYMSLLPLNVKIFPWEVKKEKNKEFAVFVISTMLVDLKL